MVELRVEIVSPQSVIFNDFCSVAVIPSYTGDIGIMHGHESIISNLSKGEIKLFDSSNNIIKNISIESGFAEMQGEDKLLILVN